MTETVWPMKLIVWPFMEFATHALDQRFPSLSQYDALPAQSLPFPAGKWETRASWVLPTDRGLPVGSCVRDPWLASLAHNSSGVHVSGIPAMPPVQCPALGATLML